MATNEFIKVGDRLEVKPKGLDYDLIPGKVYDLGYNDFGGDIIFKENGELNLPDKLYFTESDSLFRKRIINYFNKSNANTVGVMLAGTKGTGKSLTAKVLAKESNLPIIVVASNFPEGRLVKFFKSFKTPVCIIFDEVEKHFRTGRMLDFLDGIEKTTRKLVIMTCNDINRVSEYMQDRCSRIRYLRHYAADENKIFLKDIATDLQIKNVDEVANFCMEHISLLSMDNIVSFMNEVKMLEDENISLEEIIQVMNISTKGINNAVNTISAETSSDCEDNYDDEEYEEDYENAA